MLNETRIQQANESNPDYGNTREEVFDITEWISYQLAPSTRYCFMSTLEVYQFGQLKDQQFGGFSDILPAWLQNLLGNVITLNSIQKKIDDAKLANDTVALYYWYGRLMNILVVFDPIVMDEFEDEDAPSFNLLALNTINKLVFGRGFDSLATDDSEHSEEDLPGNLFTNTFFLTRGFFSTSFGDSSRNSTVC